MGCGVGCGFLGGWRVGRRGLSNVKDLMECGKRLKQDARGGNCVQRDHGIDRPIVAGSRMWIYQTPQPMWLSTEGLKWKWLNVSVNLFEAIGDGRSYGASVLLSEFADSGMNQTRTNSLERLLQGCSRHLGKCSIVLHS